MVLKLRANNDGMTSQMMELRQTHTAMIDENKRCVEDPLAFVHVLIFEVMDVQAFTQKKNDVFV